MCTNTDKKNEAHQKEEQILGGAIDIGADSIELEYVDGGLEVCYMLGSRGVGTILADPMLESEIIEIIISKAKLEDKPRGVMDWMHLGKRYHILVEEYESFGEIAFKLMLSKPE